MPRYVIWGDNEGEAEWFRALDRRLHSANIKMIGRRGTNGDLVDSLVSYDRPDIILTRNEEPVLVLEKTREVPTGHNVGQRVARLVRAAEHQIPTYFFLPFDAMKHGKYAGVCRINVRLFGALRRMSEIHGCPVLAVNWPMDEFGELIHDGSENVEIAKVIKETLDVFPALFSPFLNDAKSQLENEMKRRILQFPEYGNLPSSVEVLETRSLLAQTRFDGFDTGNLMSKPSSMVYTMDMSPEKCRRQDPYTGMQFIYDYANLRTGPTPNDREDNFFLNIPRVSMKIWQKENPNDTNSKSCNWYLTADAILLKDGLIRIDHV